MNNTVYELWIAGIDNMELWNKFDTEEEAVKVARKKKELGYVGTISIYKVTTEKVTY